MANYPIGVTKGLGTWNFQRNHVERMLDGATYDAAHPDDTLILAGPARRGVAQPGVGRLGLHAIGMLQNLSIQSSAPVMPVMGLGSGRSFFLRGKSQSNWSMQRTLINGRNLLRALMHNAVEAGINVDQFDDPAAFEGAPNSQFFINLDSELYYIPFGIAIIMRTKSRTLVASCYLELCIINSWGMAYAAGQNMVAESVTGLCDRILPFQATDAMQTPNIGRSSMDAVLGLAANVFPEPSYTSIGRFTDSAGADDPGVAMISA